MVPTPTSAASRRDHVAEGSRGRRNAFARIARSLLLPLLLIGPAANATEIDARNIRWEKAFLVGAVERRAADTDRIVANGSEKVELFVVLEGDRGGLPVYCSQFTDFRIEGRAIPSRLVVDPVTAGLTGAEIHWAELRSADATQKWQRTQLSRGDNQWSLPIIDFDGPSATGMKASSGTGRYTAAILPPDNRSDGVLETDGWSIRSDWTDPERAPGLRVSRFRGASLSGFARGYARLPVTANATVAHARERVALRPIDLVLTSYESFAGIRLDQGRDDRLDGETWSWLFEVIVESGRRSTREGGLAIGPGGRGVAWVAPRKRDDPGIRRDDILLLEDQVAILQYDDGDGWLGNQDFVMHTAQGEIAEGRLGMVPGKKFSIVRPRNFSWLRLDLREAGYGNLGQQFTYDAKLERAVSEFERDRGLPVDGRPDPDVRASLDGFLEKMRAANAAAANTDESEPTTDTTANPETERP